MLLNKNILFVFSMAIPLSCGAMLEEANKIERSVFVPKSIGHLDLYRDNDGYLVVHNNETSSVKKYNVDPLLQQLKKSDLDKFLDQGYIKVNKLSDEQFKLEACVRGDGGGPATARIAWLATQAVGWGGFAVACIIKHGEPIIHVHEIKEAIDTAAHAAYIAGLAAPLP